MGLPGGQPAAGARSCFLASSREVIFREGPWRRCSATSSSGAGLQTWPRCTARTLAAPVSTREHRRPCWLAKGVETRQRQILDTQRGNSLMPHPWLPRIRAAGGQVIWAQAVIDELNSWPTPATTKNAARAAWPQPAGGAAVSATAPPGGETAPVEGRRPTPSCSTLTADTAGTLLHRRLQPGQGG